MAYMKIQNIEDGTTKIVHAVDARECVKLDRTKDKKPKWKILGKSAPRNDPKLELQPNQQILEERIQALEDQAAGDGKEVDGNKPVSKMTMAELKDKAEEAGVEDYESMKKPELVKAIEDVPEKGEDYSKE